MGTVVEIMQILCEYFPHADEPLDYRILDEVRLNNNYIHDSIHFLITKTPLTFRTMRIRSAKITWTQTPVHRGQ